MTKDQLFKYQSVVYQVLNNALSQGNVSNAYLFIGDDETQTKEAAFLLAKSIVCQNDTFACEKCVACDMVDTNTYPDLIFLDGSVESIKKGQVLSIQEQFNRTSDEIYGKKIYILHQVENATNEALNSLLKFLEEPVKDVFAILTTSNPDSVLNTIISRCQNIKFKPMPLELCINRCLEQGVGLEDANILARITRNDKNVMEIVGSADYLSLKTATLEIIQAFLKNPYGGIYEMQGFIRDNKDGAKNDFKNSYLLMLDIMLVFFNECIYKTFTSDQGLWNELVEKGQSNNNMLIVEELLLAKDSLKKNPNIALLLDAMMSRMKEGVRSE